MATINLADWIVLGAYLVAIVGMGVWVGRRQSGAEAFMVAGRSLPGWLVGLSIFGTFVSSISFLANPGKSFQDDWNPFVFGLSLPIAAAIASRWFLPFYRRAGVVSAYQHLEARFGGWARTYAVVCFMLTQIARVATILYLVALAVAPLVGWSLPAIIVATGILVTLYTLIGGIEAVIWTDALQSVVLTAGIVLSIGVLLWQMPGGPAQLLDVAITNRKFSLGEFSASLTTSTFWTVLLYGLFINLQNFGIDQNYVQRFATAKSDAAARQSLWVGALAYLPISALLFFIGTALFAFYEVLPERLPASVIKPDGVFPHFIATELPSGITGLLVAAIIAAAMSSVDSSLNSSATLVLEDVVRRYKRTVLSEPHSMWVLRIATLGFGVLGTCGALLMIRAGSALEVWWKLAGIFSGGMLGLFLLGRLSPRAGRRAGLLAVIVGVSCILWLSVDAVVELPPALAWMKPPLHGYWTIVIATTSMVIVGFVATALLEGRGGPPKEESSG